jgi:hypothetical protein
MGGVFGRLNMSELTQQLRFNLRLLKVHREGSHREKAMFGCIDCILEASPDEYWARDAKRELLKAEKALQQGASLDVGNTVDGERGTKPSV